MVRKKDRNVVDANFNALLERFDKFAPLLITGMERSLLAVRPDAGKIARAAERQAEAEALEAEADAVKAQAEADAAKAKAAAVIKLAARIAQKAFSGDLPVSEMAETLNKMEHSY